jgi:hypothetical protein
MTDNDDAGEAHRIYVLRRADKEEWTAKAHADDEMALRCISAVRIFMRDLSNGEPIHCGCCEGLFSSSDVPEAILVLIPVKYDPDNVTVQAWAMCKECSKHDDRWLIDYGPKRKGLAPTPPRSGQTIH